MKIKFLLITLIIFTSATIFAQPYTASYASANANTSFGIKGGVNFSNQDIGYDSSVIPINVDSKTFTSIHFGVYGKFTLSSKLGFQPEILFSREGSKIDLEFIDFTQVVNFIKVPTLLNVKVFNENFSFLVGPQFGFLVSDEFDPDVDDGDASLINNAFKTFEMSGVVGAEYNFNDKFSFGARYNHALSDISNTDDATLKGNNFQIYLGVKLF